MQKLPETLLDNKELLQINRGNIFFRPAVAFKGNYYRCYVKFHEGDDYENDGVDKDMDPALDDFVPYYPGDPREIGLDLSGLGITSLDEIEGLDTLPRLDWLILHHNLLQDIDDLATMPIAATLCDINLECNLIDHLPTDITAFKQLRGIWMPNNKIHDISPVRGLVSIEYLNLSNNLISTIPSGLGKLKKLNMLGLGDNRISKIDNPLILPSKVRIILANNPIPEEEKNDIRRNLKAWNPEASIINV